MKWDGRMNIWSNLKYMYWLPFICKVRGHKYVCYRLVPTDPQKWFYWCHRCMEMSKDMFEPCGGCDNGCTDY